MRPFATLALRATTDQDRVLILVTGVALLAWIMGVGQVPGQRVIVSRDNQPILSLPLDQPVVREVAGRLGPVQIEVADGRARLLEYQSPRLIGTRTGWIERAGQVAACVPCGVVLTLEGGRAGPDETGFDAISR